MTGKRSPNYPAIGLPDAIQFARRVFDGHRRSTITQDEAAHAVGYTSMSGPARTRISAMRKFGLLDRTNGGLRVSDLGMRILHSQQDTPEHRNALQEAARNIDLIRDLLEERAEASDGSLRSHLILDLGFTEEGADTFIPVFRSTIEVAQLLENGKMPESSDGNIKGNREPLTQPHTPRLSRPQVQSGTKQDVYTLSAGDAVLQWPETISMAEYDELGEWLELMKRKLRRSVAAASDQSGASGDDD